MRKDEVLTKESYFLEVALDAARAAGAVHKKYFYRKLKIRTKSAPFDLLTVADLEAEKKAVSVIRKYFPTHNIFAEEKTYKRTASEYTWIIDPLDGTNNFAFRFPLFCVSIALAKNDTLLAGVVYNAMQEEIYTARKGRGAYLNGKKIQVASNRRLRGSLMITGFYYDRGRQMRENLEYIRRFFQKDIVGLRRFGSAALDLCFIASGRASGFWEFELNPWDFAAGKLIAEEAGGKITDKHGRPVGLKTSFIVASNGKIHNEMLAVLKRRPH